MDVNQTTNFDYSNSNENTLRLLSINKVSKILGIRYDSVIKMMATGKIAYIKINKRNKIPYISLMKFIEEQSIRNKTRSEGILSTEEISQRIDNLIVEYSGVSLN